MTSIDDEADLLEELVVEEPKPVKRGVKRKITEKRSPWTVKVLEKHPARPSSISNPLVSSLSDKNKQSDVLKEVQESLKSSIV
jgi:hypothetical protein